MIFLSKNGDDEYIDMYAHGLGVESTPLESWRYEDSTEPLMLRGIMKHKIIKQQSILFDARCLSKHVFKPVDPG